jgi:hypothetical protein
MLINSLNRKKFSIIFIIKNLNFVSFRNLSQITTDFALICKKFLQMFKILIQESINEAYSVSVDEVRDKLRVRFSIIIIHFLLNRTQN